MESCPRLVDYLLLVGANSPNRTATTPQPPVILNRFPPLDHPDFILPPDVAYFCQPEGCFCTTNWTALQSSSSYHATTSFVFTLTDKESGKIRYGVCYNFFRHVPQRDSSRPGCTYSTTGSSQLVSDSAEPALTVVGCLNSSESTLNAATGPPPRWLHTLTSLCLISHHPFFSQFKSIVEFLHTLIQKLHRKSGSELSTSDTVWDVLTASTLTATSPLVVRSVHEIQCWMLRLLSTPSPIPGKTCIYLSMHPNYVTKPLLFAQPDKSRLSLFDFPLHLPIQLLGVARVLRIIVCLLMEQKVVLQSSDYNKLSICVLALVTLIYPLQYMFPVIPLLPPYMPDAEQLLIAPTPYLIGVPTSFYSTRKIFRMPKDVWLANLDTQELSYPEVMDDIPDLPEPECGHLVDQFNRLLDSVSATSGRGSSGSTPSKGTRTIKRSNTAAISENNDCSWPQITDEASASVATRVAMILFLLSKNVLGGLSDHTRILRLYPRPVVALQFENFMKSRPRPCLFTSMLAKTQAVEYFAESGIYSQNDAYQRIEAGERSPALIGDKPQWFADLLTPISIDVGPEISSQSRISSDTETESGSTSPISMPSSFASDHLGCDIADPSSELHSDHSFHCDDSYAARSTSSLTQEVQLQSVESAFVRPGVSLPPALASQFHPPTQMVLSAPSLSPQSPDHSETIDLVHSLRKICPDDDIPADELTRDSGVQRVNWLLASELTLSVGCIHLRVKHQPLLSKVQDCKTLTLLEDGIGNQSQPEARASVAPEHCERIVEHIRENYGRPVHLLTANQLDSASHKRHSGSPFPTLSTGQTLRTLRRLSLSALSGETPFNGRDDRRPSQMINWNSPLSVLLGSVFNLANPGTDASTKSVSIVKESKKRIEEERYLDHVAHLIKQGETPGIFSRNYITSLFELESNRNLLLSRLNMTYSDYSAKQLNSHELKDVAIATWNQYKAMVWVLRKISSGIAHSLRPDLVVPTPGAVRADGAHSPTLNPAGGQSRPSGGLASAFCLLEIAHTHYFPLPTRQVQRPQSVTPDFQEEKSSTSFPTAQSTGVRSPVDDRTPDDGGLPSTSGGNSATGYMKFDPNNQHDDLTTESFSKTQAHSSDAGLTDKLSDDSSELQPSSDSSFVRSKAVKIFIDDSIFGEPKSARSRGYCYRQSKLFISPYFSRTVESVSNAVGRSSFGVSTSTQTDRDALTSTSQPGTGARVRRTYLFEDLLTDYNTRSKLWENLQFWEDAFLDAVAQERDMHGMDFHPMELLARYNTSSPLKRKHLEMEEDRLLTGLMHNMIAFMVMVDVDRTDIRRKIRRLLAKSHMGLHHSQEITNLLDVLDFLHGNDVDLKPLQSRSIPSRSYEVYAESDTAGQPLFIEVCEDYLLLRNLLGGILERWWYDQLINLSFRQQTHLLCISVRSNEQSSLNIFYTNKCQTLYQEIRSAMQKTPIKIPHESADLKGEIDVINLDSSCPGTIRLCTDGFSMRFNDQENLIPVPCIKRCSTPQHDLFMIEYFDSHEKRLQTLRLQTDVATNLLYHFHVLIADFSTRLLTSQASRSSRVSSITSKHPSTCSMSCLSDDAN